MQGSLHDVPQGPQPPHAALWTVVARLPGPVKQGHCVSVGPKAHWSEEGVAAGLRSGLRLQALSVRPAGREVHPAWRCREPSLGPQVCSPSCELVCLPQNATMLLGNLELQLYLHTLDYRT